MKIEKMSQPASKPVPTTAERLPDSKRSVLPYYVRDIQDGIRRNIGAVLATVLLIFISLSITGVMVLLKSSVDDVIRYLNDQVQVKVFVDPDVDPEQVAAILSEASYVRSVTIETKDDALDKLQVFFRDMPHLFDSFRDSKLPDAILIELVDQDQVHFIATELANTTGISEVIYAQEFAEQVVSWSRAADRYGLIILIIFLVASILTVSIAMNLSLYQRQKDIRVKLLLGAKESHVRGQFLVEGIIIGFLGSLLAAFTVYLIYEYALYQLQVRFSSVFDFSAAGLNVTLIGIIGFGMLIGLVGTYYSTRKMLRHA